MAATGSKKQWRDLTAQQQRGIVVAGLVEVVLTSLAVRDLVRRPPSQVRGPKPLWLLSFVVQPVGPVGYLLVGRRRA